MNIQTKSSILVLSIFIFGVVCGFFLRSVFISDRFPEPHGPRGPMHFSQRIEEILHLNGSQLQAVDPILKKYDAKMLGTLDYARQQGMEVMDSMKTELKPFLNENQNKVLDNELDHFKNFPPPGEPRH